MRVFVWVVAALLSVLVILLSLVGTFHDDAFFHFAYQRNGAYDRADVEMAWLVTENFQHYINSDEELFFFQEDQASHLEDVKRLYQAGVGTARLLVALLAVLFVVLAYPAQRSRMLGTMFCRAGMLLIISIGLIALLSLRWEWFFTGFHELFFDGNWQFSSATLMLRLWGGSFFPLAAGYIILKNVLAGVFLLLLGKVISRLSRSR